MVGTPEEPLRRRGRHVRGDVPEVVQRCRLAVRPPISRSMAVTLRNSHRRGRLGGRR